MHRLRTSIYRASGIGRVSLSNLHIQRYHYQYTNQARSTTTPEPPLHMRSFLQESGWPTEIATSVYLPGRSPIPNVQDTLTTIITITTPTCLSTASTQRPRLRTHRAAPPRHL